MTDDAGREDGGGDPVAVDEPGYLDHEVGEPRAATGREWEVFVREDDAERLFHAGSLSAPDRDVALEQARLLFGWTAETLWLCPGDEVTRRTDADLALANR